MKKFAMLLYVILVHNWKTTIAGLATVVFVMLSYNGVSTSAEDRQKVVEMIIGIGLILSKDANKSGNVKSLSNRYYGDDL